MAANNWKSPNQTTSDFVSAMCASDSVLMVGRTSGVVQRYSLPHLTGLCVLLLLCVCMYVMCT